MHILDIIEKKKRALELSDAEIDFMVKAVLDPNTPDYQLAALLMGAIDISDERTEPVPLIHARIEAKDVL